MGRIRDAVVTGARAVRRIPIPSTVTHQALREARSPLPPGHVLKTHAIEHEMIGRTRTIWLDEHRADGGIIVFLHGGAYVSGPFASDWAWLSRQVDALDCAGPARRAPLGARGSAPRRRPRLLRRPTAARAGRDPGPVGADRHVALARPRAHQRRHHRDRSDRSGPRAAPAARRGPPLRRP